MFKKPLSALFFKHIWYCFKNDICLALNFYFVKTDRNESVEE